MNFFGYLKFVVRSFTEKCSEKRSDFYFGCSENASEKCSENALKNFLGPFLGHRRKISFPMARTTQKIRKVFVRFSGWFSGGFRDGFRDSFRAGFSWQFS